MVEDCLFSNWIAASSPAQKIDPESLRNHLNWSIFEYAIMCSSYVMVEDCVFSNWIASSSPARKIDPEGALDLPNSSIFEHGTTCG